ncbi:pilus assembly protein PilM [Candidatus Babela massiliensis]|uniref:Tfp pilus assembly protein ATPase PilM n=1 Tax=Candidatus Babela massiliensis TaxID=673862 RepID=V6DJL4_9BACT|nr:pilus assembly protein PilM [Candidatus Babela massiliensis]CDK30706.1 Tfp pilus assembly protein ATPase PilM [Candidatus Babela massiliensis]
MISDVIIPEKIGSYYLFSKKIVAIDIGRSEIRASIVLAQGHKRTILSLIEEKIENNSNLDYQERVVNALRELKIRLGQYDYLFASFSSASVVFKELTLPFVGEKKIKMVVPFEVESLLPFTLDQAIVDNIIINENKKESQTEVLVAAVKKEYIDQYINLFNQANLKLDKITIDILDLYGLYISIPNYQSKTKNVALIDLGLNNTRLALLIDNQLKYIRIIPHGIKSAAQKIQNNLENDLKIDLNEIVNNLVRFGINLSESESYQQITKNSLIDLFSELQFTINTYATRLKANQEIKLIIITGMGAEIPGIKELIQNTINIETDVLETKKIIHNGKITSKVSSIPNSFLISIATALAPYITSNFNLYKSQEESKENRLIITQLASILGLLLLIISSFSLYSYLRVRKLKRSVYDAQSSAIQELKKNFQLRDVRDLKDANKKANAELLKQENAWQQLSVKNRYSMLKYLSELSKCINPQEIQLDLSSIDIKNNKIILYGSVPGYPQLSKLQNQLKCPLFKNPPRLQDYNFKAEPIILNVTDIQES